MRRGFTLVELLVAVAILLLLASIVMASFATMRERAYLAKAQEEMHSFRQALELYALHHGGAYPPDVSRNVPADLKTYLSGTGTDWPNGPWPGSVYDWDNWDDPSSQGGRVYQISIRFCPEYGPLSACRFPAQPWAADFDVNSAYYLCVSGSCRAHKDEAASYPGYCVNCSVQPSGT